MSESEPISTPVTEVPPDPGPPAAPADPPGLRSRLAAFARASGVPGALAALVVVSFLSGLGVLATVVYALAFVYLLARLMTRFWLLPLEVTREISEDTVEIGDHVKVVTSIRNRAPWPILWVYAEETLPERTPSDGTHRRLLFLPPRRTFYLTYRVTPVRRGVHRIGPIVLETGDVFGLFRRCRVDSRRDFVTALPAYSVVEEFEVGRRRKLGSMVAVGGLFEDPARPRGVREYRRGDPRKNIHWRTSARRGSLHVRINEPVTEAAATIVLDFHVDGWAGARSLNEGRTPMEAGVETACTLARYLHDGGWRVGLLTNGRDPLGVPGATMAQARATDTLSGALEAARLGRPDHRLEPIHIPSSRAPEQFSILRENLGRVEPTDGLPLADALLSELPRIPREDVLVVVAGDSREDLLRALSRARELGYRVQFFLVDNNSAHDRAFEALAPRGVDVYRIDDDRKLREIATGRRSI